MSRGIKGNHLPAISAEIVPVGKTAAVAERQQLSVILLRYRVSLLRPPACLILAAAARSLLIQPVQITVHILPVNGYNACRILRLLHPSLNLKGEYAALCKCGNGINRTQILRA